MQNNQYFGQIAIKLMSITELVSTIRLKDSITFTLNSESLDHNFDIVRQCLLRIKDLESHIGKSKDTTSTMDNKIKDMQLRISQNQENIHQNQLKIRDLNANVGDEFMKKMYAIEEKTRNMFDFEETVRRIENMNKFVLLDDFNDQNALIQAQFDQVWKLKEDFDRYLLNSNFDKYKMEQFQQLQEKQRLIDQCNEEIRRLREEIAKMNTCVLNVEENVKENNAMIKEINFTEFLDKIKKFKDETESRVTELSAKLKKKVSQGELLNLQKSMIEKLDKFLADNEKSKAEKQETKEALVFLEKKINDIEDIVIHKATDEDKDALFSARKWQCASCTKDLGKYEGKLGQYRPWSIFPCKELDPEKTGGFGYLNYIDKVAYKKGIEGEQPGLERLNKTFYETKDKQSPSKRLGSTRGSNLINNYGSEDKGSSLKQVYFKETAERAGSTQRIFRVTRKQQAKLSIQNEQKVIHQQ